MKGVNFARFYDNRVVYLYCFVVYVENLSKMNAYQKGK